MQTAIHVIARGVSIKEDKILLCHNKERGFYYLPGGHVEHGETAVQALERELHEELGMNFAIGRFLGLFEYVFIPDNPNKCHNHEYNLVFLVDSQECMPSTVMQALEDDIGFAWIALNDLSDTPFKPKVLCGPLIEWLTQNHAAALVVAKEL